MLRSHLSFLPRFAASALLAALTPFWLLTGCATANRASQTQTSSHEQSHGLVQPVTTERDTPEAVAALAGLSALGYISGAFGRYDDRPASEQPSDDAFRSASDTADAVPHR